MTLSPPKKYGDRNTQKMSYRKHRGSKTHATCSGSKAAFIGLQTRDSTQGSAHRGIAICAADPQEASKQLSMTQSKRAGQAFFELRIGHCPQGFRLSDSNLHWNRNH
eukprot:1146478-Pelagomonas_calceolata.AAC.3